MKEKSSYAVPSRSFSPLFTTFKILQGTQGNLALMIETTVMFHNINICTSRVLLVVVPETLNNNIRKLKLRLLSQASGIFVHKSENFVTEI